MSYAYSPHSGELIVNNPIADWMGVTLVKPPNFNPEREQCFWRGSAWELVPIQGQESKPAFPIFVGNQKLDLFTPAEQLAVVTATMSDPQVKLLYDRMLGAAFMTYEDPETEQGLSLLVAKNLLTAERKAEIVATMAPR